MSVVRVARAIGFALASLILAVSGVYVVIDLARWEWNRAILSALVFVASLVVLVAMILFRQLARLEARMTTLERQGRAPPNALGALRAANHASVTSRFRWLEQPPDRTAVFIPVLLGAGVVLSFVAYVIERIAGAIATVTVDRQTAGHLAADLPLGPGPPEPMVAVRSPSPTRHRVAVVLALLVTAVLAVVAVQGLRELTQSRPGEVTSVGSTSIVVEIGQSRYHRPVAVVADDLWSSCRSRVGGTIEVVAITEVADDRVLIEVDRSLGRTGRARVTGCLEDYTLDLVRAEVVSIETEGPAAGGVPS